MIVRGFTFGRLWQVLLAGYTIRALYLWGTEHERALAESVPRGELADTQVNFSTETLDDSQP